MTMQLPLSAFGMAGAHPLRKARRARFVDQSRAWAVVITIIAHIIAVTAIVEGLRQTNIFHAPDIVTVHIEPRKKQVEELPPPVVPAMIRPITRTAPMPMFNIDRPADPTVGVTPATPAPPMAASAPPAPTQLPATKGAVTWQGLLLARLERAKRYPLFAESHRQQGVVLLHFTMDRSGAVLTANTQKSSGFTLLDQESLAMVRRAQPLPRPPPEVTGDPVDLIVPVEFFLDRLISENKTQLHILWEIEPKPLKYPCFVRLTLPTPLDI